MPEATELTGALEYHVANTLWAGTTFGRCSAPRSTQSGPAPTACSSPLLRVARRKRRSSRCCPHGGWLAGPQRHLRRAAEGAAQQPAAALEQYASWLGRRVALWHGDVGDGERRRILSEPPDILLTTPESLEAMLVSRRVEHHLFFLGAHARRRRGALVRGIRSRLAPRRGARAPQRIAAAPVQRIGLSATLGNPDEVLRWLQARTLRGRAGAWVVGEADIAPPGGHARLRRVGGQRRRRAVAAVRGGEAARLLRVARAGGGARV